MANWTFRCYVSTDGTDEIRAAYDRKQKATQRKFLSRLSGMLSLPYEDWFGVVYKELHGAAAGLGEIRFLSDGVQQRILAYRSGDNELTLLYWATEKGSKFVPMSAPTIASTRKAEALKSRDMTNDLWLALE